MDAKLKADWVKALRSGEYEQAVGVLFEHGSNNYCCLGVLCKIQGADFGEIEREFGTLSLSINPKRYLGSLDGRGDTLSSMNDGGKSFSEIADYIEAVL